MSTGAIYGRVIIQYGSNCMGQREVCGGVKVSKEGGKVLLVMSILGGQKM
jgi:hypothetical protein